MNAFAERLRRRETALLDGGLGSLLIARGLAGGEAPESWVLSRPDDVRRVHGDYVGAGSDAVHAATFGANAIRLARRPRLLVGGAPTTAAWAAEIGATWAENALRAVAVAETMLGPARRA